MMIFNACGRILLKMIILLYCQYGLTYCHSYFIKSFKLKMQMYNEKLKHQN